MLLTLYDPNHAKYDEAYNGAVSVKKAEFGFVKSWSC